MYLWVQTGGGPYIFERRALLHRGRARVLRPRTLQAEPQPVQIDNPQLGINRTAQPFAHPRRRLAPAPQTAIRRRTLQQRRQRRPGGRVKHRLPTGVAAPPIAETGKAVRVPALDQLLDPAHPEPRHPRDLRRHQPVQQQPHHLKMRTPNRVPLAPIRRHDLRNRTALHNRQRNTPANPLYLVAGTYRIIKPSNQSTEIGMILVSKRFHLIWLPASRPIFVGKAAVEKQEAPCPVFQRPSTRYSYGYTNHTDQKSSTLGSPYSHLLANLR